MMKAFVWVVTILAIIDVVHRLYKETRHEEIEPVGPAAGIAFWTAFAVWGGFLLWS